jgi:hypothetical protein
MKTKTADTPSRNRISNTTGDENDWGKKDWRLKTTGDRKRKNKTSEKIKIKN